MAKFKILILFAIVIGWLGLACQHPILNSTESIIKDTVVVVNPPTTGNGGTTTASDTVCFNSDVLPLYVSYCGSSGCHNVASHKEGVVLTDYGYIMNGIKAMNTTGSSYYRIIGNGMPPSGSPQMTATNIATIKKWIDQGALNTNCTNVCDTTTYTYTNAIQTILANNCGGCHGSQPGSANVYLGTYASAKAYVSANTVLFNNAIDYSTSILTSQRMPPAGKLVDCKITQIKKWIANGYPQ
jgi:uncharacterized membrane protein